MRDHPTQIRALIPARVSISHKGTYGRLLIIAGSNQYTGAAELVVEAALRSGVGMVFVATVKSAADVIKIRSPEAIVIECPDHNGVLDSERSLSIIKTVINDRKINSFCIGSGLGVMNDMDIFFEQMIQHFIEKKIPGVFDADGLINATKVCFKKSPNKNQFIFTPHPKEFARIAEVVGVSLNKNIEKSMQSWIQIIDQIIVYKNNQTLVSSTTEVWKTPRSSIALATAGTGDVLAGLIAGLLAQNMTTFNAAKLGVYIHGLAAQIGEKKYGVRSFLARDLCDIIPNAFMELTKEDEK